MMGGFTFNERFPHQTEEAELSLLGMLECKLGDDWEVGWCKCAIILSIFLRVPHTSLDRYTINIYGLISSTVPRTSIFEYIVNPPNENCTSETTV
jgi:hypothetical protein